MISRWIGLEVLAFGMIVAGGTEVNGAQLPAVAIFGVVLGLGVTLLLFVFLCLQGTCGRNRFGPDPRDTNADLDAERIFG